MKKTEIELIPKMENLVKHYTKHYKSDFEYDKLKLEKAIDNEIKKPQYIFIVRTCGTYLLSFKELEDGCATSIYEYYENDYDNAQYYEVTMTDKEKIIGTIKKIKAPIDYRKEKEWKRVA